MQWYNDTTTTSTDNWISNTFYSGLSTQGEGIDLRQEMSFLLYGNPPRSPKGHWIIYRRYDRTRPSKYYKKSTKEGVGGPAYEYTDSLVRTRRVPLDKNGNPLDPLKAGMDIGDKYCYYFTYDVNPKRGDHIIEVSLNDHSITPNVDTVELSEERYLIKRTHGYRLENGNIQYWIVSCDYDEIRY